MDEDTPISGGTDATASIEEALSALDDALLDGGGAAGETAKKTMPSVQSDDPSDYNRLVTTSASTNKSAPEACQWFASSAYRKRLSTFRTETYFAKPLEVSPLECARFG